jgi:hypothetical protein
LQHEDDNDYANDAYDQVRQASDRIVIPITKHDCPLSYHFQDPLASASSISLHQTPKNSTDRRQPHIP